MEFRKVKDFPNYSVSNTGLVRNDKSGKLIGNTGKDGYVRNGLYNKYERQTRTAHSLVAEAFLGYDPKSMLCVDHKDNDRGNNHVDNLQVMTHLDNLNKNSKYPIGITFATIHGHEYFRFDRKVQGERYTKYFKTLQEALDHKEWFDNNTEITGYSRSKAPLLNWTSKSLEPVKVTSTTRNMFGSLKRALNNLISSVSS